MAEVSNLHGHRPSPSRRPVPTFIGSNLEEAVREEDELYNPPHPFIYDFDSFSPRNNPSFFDDFATSFTENLECEYEEPNCFFIEGEEDDDQMNYVTDLFEPRQTHVTDDQIWGLGSQQVEDPSLEFGFGPGLGSNIGLRVVSMDSESDSEVNAGFVNDEDDNYNDFGVSNHRYHASEDEREEFEWEEISERIQYDESLNLVINRIEEISVSSNISSSNSSLGDDGEGAEVDLGRNIEWEVLLASNNLERNLGFGNVEEHRMNVSDVPHINLPEDHILTVEYDPLDNASKGSPPAAKSVVENLPFLVLTKEDVEEKNRVVTCAVCKDEFAIGEKVTRLPCSHMYHGECILPWLGIRNTCPVCRHELPTDDLDYEKRKDGRSSGGGSGSGSGGGLFDNFEVRYNFELLP